MENFSLRGPAPPSGERFVTKEKELLIPAPATDFRETRPSAGAHASATTGKFVHDVFFSNLPIPFLKFRTYLWLMTFSRALGVSGFGEWSILMVTLGLATGLSSLNLGSAMMRFLCGERTAEEVNRAWTTVLLTVLATSGVVAVGLSLLWRTIAVSLVPQSVLLAPGLLLGLALCTDLIYEEERSLLRARRRNRLWAGLTLGRAFPETALTIGVAWATHNVVVVMATYCCCSALAALSGWLYLRRVIQLQLLWPSWTILRIYGGYGMGLMPGALASLLAINGDRYLVAHYLDLRRVGIYSIVVAISGLVGFLVGPINDVLVPELSVLYDRKQWDLFYSRLRGIQKFVWGFSAGMAALLAVYPAEVIRLFASRDCTEGWVALSVMGLQGALMAIVILQIVVLNVQLRVLWSSGFWSGMAAITLLCDLVLVPRLGITGAALGQCIAALSALSVLLVVNRDTVRRTFSATWLGQVIASAALVYATVLVTGRSAPGPVQAFMRLAGGSAAFVVGLLATGYFRLSDFKALRGLLRTAADSAKGNM